VIRVSQARRLTRSTSNQFLKRENEKGTVVSGISFGTHLFLSSSKFWGRVFRVLAICPEVDLQVMRGVFPPTLKYLCSSGSFHVRTNGRSNRSTIHSVWLRAGLSINAKMGVRPLEVFCGKSRLYKEQKKLQIFYFWLCNVDTLHFILVNAEDRESGLFLNVPLFTLNSQILTVNQ
jgi:hypothetical protein